MQKDCRRGILLSWMVSGFVIVAPVLRILGASDGITTCGNTMGQMVGVVDTYFAGSGWWLILEVGRMSEVSMCTGTSKVCGGSGGGTSSQMGSCNGFMGERSVSGEVGGNALDVLRGQCSDVGVISLGRRLERWEE